MSKNFFVAHTLDILYEEMRMVYLNDSRPWIIGYSGGKDSTVMVQLVFNMLKQLPESQRIKPVYVISSDTLIENPIILNNLHENMKLIKASGQAYNIHSQIVYPRITDTFWVNIIGRGYPTPKSIQYRWCTERLKITPANDFIKDHLNNEDVVILIGVRKSESQARKQRIENKQIEGYLLTPHETLKHDKHKAYVYSPIVDFSTDDVWEVLLNTDQAMSPWGSNNKELFSLYAQGSGDTECPFVVNAEESKKSTCGNSRFGCWVCTVVNEDKSLKGFIDSGHEWLIPLAQFRDWLKSDEFRNSADNRKHHRRNGAVVVLGEGTDNERKSFGPFNFKARKMILRELLRTEKVLNEMLPDANIELIKREELKIIDEIWDNEEDLHRNQLVTLYHEITGQQLPWHNLKQPLFDDETLDLLFKLSDDYNIDHELLTSLLIKTDQHKYYNNTKYLRQELTRILNQQWLHFDKKRQAEKSEEITS